MKIQAYLVISDRGGLRVNKTVPALNNNEIAVLINLDIPDVFFRRLIPSVNIELPQEAVLTPDANVAVSIAAMEISDKLKLDFQRVQDGLMQMVEEKKQNEKVE